MDLAERAFAPELFKQVCAMMALELNPTNRNAMRVISTMVENYKKMPALYRDIVYTEIIVATFHKQTCAIAKSINDLSKGNISDCL